jgi:TATA-box binding protein (TBP) (component of TFIID and TFIIIB)
MRVTNVVSMFTPSDYGHPLKDLEKLGGTRCCHAVKLRVDNTCVMIWTSKVQIMGAKTEKQARDVADTVVSLLQGAGLEDIAVNDYRLLTVTGTFTLGDPIDLTRVPNIFYESGFQNSAILRTNGFTALIYPSGTVIAAGFPSEASCLNSMFDLFIELFPYCI